MKFSTSSTSNKKNDQWINNKFLVIILGIVLFIVLPIIIFGGIGFLDKLQYYTSEDYDIDKCENTLVYKIHIFILILVITYILITTILKDFFDYLITKFRFLKHIKEITIKLERSTEKSLVELTSNELEPLTTGESSKNMKGSDTTYLNKFIKAVLICIIPILGIIISIISLTNSHLGTIYNIINTFGLIFVLIISNKLLNEHYSITITIVVLCALISFLLSCQPSYNGLSNGLTIACYCTTIAIVIANSLNKEALIEISLFKK